MGVWEWNRFRYSDPANAPFENKKEVDPTELPIYRIPDGANYDLPPKRHFSEYPKYFPTKPLHKMTPNERNQWLRCLAQRKIKGGV